ncbi:DUF2442 domain-containing protein [Candidatus Igneacidithiobacillus taiwanensis]|uniref:DUF2442 domain-containing protein n=1 Tax=Candidatus Igneacidithiobacillus taiwanensis TaxID=1945924 RepID=UPI0028A1B036|nr:DUF2442 domain-containing protein [Candidatus Igneacidithiobacillus taiwanensis]
MCAQSVTQKDSTVDIVPPIRISAPWRVASVRPADGYRLHVEFTDGTAGEVWMDELIHGPMAGVFAQLADPSVFATVYLEYGVVTWPGEIDLAPDAMYEEIKAKGRWVLK